MSEHTEHDTGPVFYQKDGFEPKIAVTPTEKVNLEAAGWRLDDRARGNSGKPAKRAPSNPNGNRRRTAPAKASVADSTDE